MKNVEIVIIESSRGEILRQKVLKALANPARIFYVPYTLAILNFLIWFMVFVIAIILFTVLPPNNIPMWLPLVFLGILALTHSILAFYSKKDPQISQLIFSSVKIIKNRIPRRLVV
ncbi:MAG: VirB3 family type IV secretion system protein [Alphaproteobacteria bacterium]|nr:VirB3 family type IV secretion system protein [Alphaproteobacteria bacterium]